MFERPQFAGATVGSRLTPLVATLLLVGAVGAAVVTDGPGDWLFLLATLPALRSVRVHFARWRHRRSL